MSMVITIKRSPEKSPLTGQELRRLVQEDSSLSGGEREPIIWTDPANGTKRCINVAPESGELETDDMRGDEASICRFLDKLRTIARILDARVFGEGEDITDPNPAPPPRAGCTSVIVCAVMGMALVSVVIGSLR